MADQEKGDGGAPPRDTYIPKPPSKEEVDQVSREQGMISDEWTGEPSAAEAERATGGGAGARPGSGGPPGEEGDGA